MPLFHGVKIQNYIHLIKLQPSFRTDPMFVDGVDALKVKPLFSLAKGLYLDVKALAEAIVDLWEHPTKRESLGRSARETFLKKHTVERMIKETICVYKNR